MPLPKLFPEGFVYKIDGGYVVFTGAKHRLTAAIVDVAVRKPSQAVAGHLSRRIMQLGLRLAHVPAEKAKQVSKLWAGYMGKSIDAQCDALVVKPFGEKLRGMFMAGFREDVMADALLANSAILDAVDEART